MQTGNVIIPYKNGLHRSGVITFQRQRAGYPKLIAAINYLALPQCLDDPVGLLLKHNEGSRKLTLCSLDLS